MIDWDKWREDYDTMSFDDQVAFYSEVWKAHPDQVHFNHKAIKEFFEYIRQLNLPDLSVLEVGGWRGEAAAYVWGSDIADWTNIEICKEACENSIAKFENYHSFSPKHWPWEMLDPFFCRDILVLSHVIEHMKWVEFSELIDKCYNITYVYIESPITYQVDGPEPWKGYIGTHILEKGWVDVIDKMAKAGYEEIYELQQADTHCFRLKGMADD